MPARRSATPLAALLVGVLVGVLAWAVLAPSVATAQEPPPRALWVWGQEDPRSLVEFAQQHGVRELYVGVTPTVRTDGDLPRLRALARLAAPAGIRLLALGGDPAWTTSPRSALAWQRTALSTGLFAGTHLDVEPHALPGWSNRKQRNSLARKYLTLLDRLQAADPRPLEVDVPFWYQTVDSPTGRRTLADDVLDRADAVTVMSYRDTAAGILDVGSDLLRRAAALAATTGRRVPVRLAAETTALPDCTYCTFIEEGGAALALAAAAVDAGAATSPVYAGLAVHDHRGWTTLRP